MYNCTKTESKRHYKFSYISKACQNTTSRRHFFLNSTIFIITLNTCTYTTCILQLFRRKSKPLISKASEQRFPPASNVALSQPIFFKKIKTLKMRFTSHSRSRKKIKRIFSYSRRWGCPSASPKK